MTITRRYSTLALSMVVLMFFSGTPDKPSFDQVKKNFVRGYQELGIPEMEYAYKDYFNNIPSQSAVAQQRNFFNQQATLFAKLDKKDLSTKELTEYDHLQYEINFNLYRLALEKEWLEEGRRLPEGGLSQLNNHGKWYQYFIKKFTSTNITPEEVFVLGEREVARVSREIETTRKSLDYKDNSSFQRHLGNDTFFITDKDKIIEGFAQIDQQVRKQLGDFIGSVAIPPVYAMEWPGAGPNTPPGIYLNRSNTAYGKDVFQFNFSTGRYNRRAMEWLYMHEAIPGQHLQSSIVKRTELQQLFLYPGNFEGWGCYVEYLGKDLGLYKDPYSYLGKWEWDLVRSARLVLDAGIHYYGWDHDKALAYWKATIPGQDDIAEREITRVTNWCGQALSYKVGADFIMSMKKEWMEKHKGYPIRDFHLNYLNAGAIPLVVLKKHLLS